MIFKEIQIKLDNKNSFENIQKKCGMFYKDANLIYKVS